MTEPLDLNRYRLSEDLADKLKRLEDIRCKADLEKFLGSQTDDEEDLDADFEERLNSPSYD